MVTAQNLQSIKTLLILELSQYCKSGSTFSSSKHIVAGSDCSRLWNVLCLCSPNLPKPCRSSATRDWQLILQSKPTIVFCDSLRGDCQMTCRGSNFDSNLNSAARPTKCEGLSAQKSLKKLCGVWILVESVKDALFLCLSCAGAHCSAAPRARPLSLHSRPSIVFCDSFDQHGLEPWLWLKLELYCLTKDI